MSSPLEKGVELFHRDCVQRLAIQYGGDTGVYCGFEHCVEKLRTLGFLAPEESIVPIPINRAIFPKLNTLTEMILTIRKAKELGWKKLVIVAPAFHQLRSFITAVTVAIREYPELSLYNCPGTPLPWHEHVVHSQGIVRGFRTNIFRGEIERIAAYQAVGTPYPLLPNKAVLEYLEKRD
ncbi:MAG: hypothetical protein HY457_01630 [Parcubacteria group bacterium]|nr:hypothetical protein [Parcubacteria group bacterium]